MATTDFLLELDGVKGESTVTKDFIDIQSFSWGVSNSGNFAAGGGGGAGKSHFQDVTFVKYVDKASPALAQNCASGKHIPKAVLHVRKAGDGQKEYYTVTLTDVLVSSFSAGGHSGEPLVTDQFTLNFAKIHWEYKVQDSAGALTAGGELKYDVKQAKVA